MQIIKNIGEMQTWSNNVRKENRTIGFVPTMGYFHEGHLNLMREARKQCDRVVVSIYVNPTQFGPQEDFTQYPRDLNHDISLAEPIGIDCLFIPSDEQIYPEGYQTYVTVEQLSKRLCGKSRPGHFRGVATIVTKLLNIVQPDTLYLGQKDAQQAILLSKMVQDLNIPVKVVILPTTRECDGLAMSSRNKYLSDNERRQAVVLYQSLQLAQSIIKQGEKNAARIIQAMQQLISSQPDARIDYVSIVDPKTLDDVNVITEPVLIAIAVYIGKTRLIDNIIIE
ncbi:MAG: pantoate--beta-alanine ligase [bacterium]|nr:pantoate--beta-alanine ligase [bacterium]